MTSSNRLVSLFNSFTNPSFLLSDEGHPRLLFFLCVSFCPGYNFGRADAAYSRLEVFNGVILNHLNENPNLIYAILRSHRSFEDLGTFTLARGLREIRRVQLAKEEQAKRQAGNAKGKRAGDGEEEAPEQEKARLLSSESRDAIGLATEPDLEARMPRDRSLPTNTDPASPPPESELDRTGSEQPPLSASTSNAPRAVSEKARGKMRERQRSESMDVSGSLERIAAAGVGRNGFVPTQDWVTSWHQG